MVFCFLVVREVDYPLDEVDYPLGAMEEADLLVVLVVAVNH